MPIVIPMSRKGQRFPGAGYRVPKPLIEVDGRPIIEHREEFASNGSCFHQCWRHTYRTKPAPTDIPLSGRVMEQV